MTDTTDDRPLRCNVCGSTFSTARGFAAHFDRVDHDYSDHYHAHEHEEEYAEDLSDLPDDTAPEGFDSWDEFAEAVDENTITLTADSLGGLADEIEAYAEREGIDLERDARLRRLPEDCESPETL